MPLRVWAPLAKEVAASIEGRRGRMVRNESGWWSTESTPSAGTRYFFIIDGSKPLPDPRSASQPEGVHGPSVVVDHSRFQWHDAAWQPPPFGSAVVYELHVGTFTTAGTFLAAQEKLRYLKDLGITHVELMPVNEFPGTRGWGYDGVDLYAPYHHYGTPNDLKSLVDACHRCGLAVLLDVVYNHLGPSGNYLAQFAPYFTDHYNTPWGAAVNFDNIHSDEVRRFFIDNALMWLRDYHFDGLRLDAVHAIVDVSALHFLEELTAEIELLSRQQGKSYVVIAESDRNDPRFLLPTAAGGYGVHAQWSDDFHHALHTVLTGERDGYYEDFGALQMLGKALSQGFVYDGCYSRHRKRRHGRRLEHIAASRLLGYMQNHDQIGNRAKGERISALVSSNRVKIGAALVLTASFVPMLFQGEEWASSSPFCYFSGHEEAALAQAVREGRRREFAAFGWDPDEVPDPQSEETFLRSKLDWGEKERGIHREVLDWYRSLIALRHASPGLRGGQFDDLTVTADERRQVLLVHRGRFCTACNLSSRPAAVTLHKRMRVVLASLPGVTLEGEELTLPPESVAVARDVES